jgi:uncharacterized protein (DUF1684 family)
MKKTNAIYFFGIIVAVILILIYTFADTQANENYVDKLNKFRIEKDEFFNSSDQSPITQKDKFNKLSYYPADLTYRIRAAVELIHDTTKLKVRMTGGEAEYFIKYGYATFKLKDKSHKLLLLLQLNNEDEKDKLFLPFTDKTNGFETYGGGRYLDLDLEKDDQLIIDFNFAYNPFCAYNDNYTCPVPPAENQLDIEIKAGEKEYVKDEAKK